MLKESSYYNFFGEFKDKGTERNFLDTYWSQNKKVYFIAYNLCTILLLFAGIFMDYKRTFFWGSPDQLTTLRIIQLFFALGFYFKFKNQNYYSKSIEYYAFFLMIWSSVIILLLNLMTDGLSKTMVLGAIINTLGYYIVLPGRLICSLLPAFIQVFSIAFFYNTEAAGLGDHKYIIFLMFSINCILIFYKKMNAISNRRGYLIAEYHKGVSIAKDTILSIIGHDLKNPLTIIHSRNHFLKKALDSGDIEKAKSQIEPLNNATNRISDMLQSLLSWALANNQSVNKELLCIKKVAQTAYEYCLETAQQKNIQITKSVESYSFNFDSNMMETIIRNLLSNAVKFTPVSKEIYLNGRKEDSKYILEVEDQGIGMTDEMVQQILKGDNEQSELGTRGEKGTGLGLKIVLDFIRHHEAQLNINSTKEKGTKFTIEFNT